jgi:hypothetical protein
MATFNQCSDLPSFDSHDILDSYHFLNSIAKSKVTLSASPCRIVETVYGSPSRHVRFGNGMTLRATSTALLISSEKLMKSGKYSIRKNPTEVLQK